MSQFDANPSNTVQESCVAMVADHAAAVLVPVHIDALQSFRFSRTGRS